MFAQGLALFFQIGSTITAFNEFGVWWAVANFFIFFPLTLVAFLLPLSLLTKPKWFTAILTFAAFPAWIIPLGLMQHFLG